jgi:hypothetical protein
VEEERLMSDDLKLPAWSGPVRRPNNGIDVMLDHPELGPIPFTADPADPEPLGPLLHAAILAAEAAGEVTIPDAPPPPDPGPPELTPRQFEWLLAHTGLEDVWDAVQAWAKADGNRALYAGLKAQRAASVFVLATTLAFKNEPAVLAITAAVAPDADLSDDAVRAAWDLAAAQTFETLTAP